MRRKRTIYIDFKKRKKAEDDFDINPDLDPNIDKGQKPTAFSGLQAMSRKPIFLDFKGKMESREGFKVDKKNDANVTYRKNRRLLGEVYREKKYEMPPGPRCPKEERITSAARSEGPRNSIDDAFYILSVSRHMSECSRCQAIYDKARLEKSCRIERRQECKDDN